MATRGLDIVSLIKRQIEEFGGDLAWWTLAPWSRSATYRQHPGLQGVRSNKLLDFGNDVLGLALNWRPTWWGGILGRNAVKEGDRCAHGTHHRGPVGDADGPCGSPAGTPPGRQGRPSIPAAPVQSETWPKCGAPVR